MSLKESWSKGKMDKNVIKDTSKGKYDNMLDMHSFYLSRKPEILSKSACFSNQNRTKR